MRGPDEIELAGGWMTKQDAGISEIRMVTLSVADLDASLRFYRDGMGWLELGRT